MKKFSLILAFVLCLGVLCGCGNASDKETLKVFNWGEYIGEDVIDDFEEQFGVKVIYDTFATNEEMYTKLSADPGSYDVIFPSEYMADRMIKEGLISKLNMENIPNYSKIDDKFKGLYYDENNQYTVPYTWGTLGIIYNTELVDETVDSWDILWNEKYSRQILMLDSHRDSIGAALKKLGYSLNTINESELTQASELLSSQKPSVLAYVVDEMNDKLIGEEAAMSLSWSGNALEVMAEEPGKFNYVIPKEGSNWFVDVVCVTEQSQHKDLAEKFINFLCETDIATRNCDEIRYSTPISEVRDEMMAIDPDFANNTAAFPTDDMLYNMEMFITNDEINKVYDNIWEKLKAQ